MFDIGWLEMVVIGTVALVVVGPKDLPVLFRTAGQFMAKVRAMAREFQTTMEQAAKESGLDEAAKGMDAFTNLGLGSATASAQKFARNVMMGDAAKAAPRAPSVPEASAGKKPAVPQPAASETPAVTTPVQRKAVTRKKATPKAGPTEPQPVAKGKASR